MNNSPDHHPLHTTHHSKNVCPTDGDNGDNHLEMTRNSATLQLQKHLNHPTPTSSGLQGPVTQTYKNMHHLIPAPLCADLSLLNPLASKDSSPVDPPTDAPTSTPLATPAHIQTSTKQGRQATPTMEHTKTPLKMTRSASPNATCPSDKWPSSNAGTAPLDIIPQTSNSTHWFKTAQTQSTEQSLQCQKINSPSGNQSPFQQQQWRCLHQTHQNP